MTGFEHRLRRSRMADASRIGVRLMSERIGALQSGIGGGLWSSKPPLHSDALGKVGVRKTVSHRTGVVLMTVQTAASQPRGGFGRRHKSV